MRSPADAALMAAFIALSAMVVTSLPRTGFAAPAAFGSASECPSAKIMHGLLPFLFWIGILPKPTMATTIAQSDTSTSVVIRPNPDVQISCGKTQINSVNDVVFARPTAANGKSIELSMDVLIPQPSRRRPLVIFVTGGGFVQASKEAALNLRTYVAEAGFVVASVEYRTVRNGADYRDGIADVKSAIRYLRANAAKYDIDKDHVAVWGESAGGYLAAMVGVTNGNASFEAGPDLHQSSVVQAVVDKFGASDMSKIASDFDPQTQSMYAGANPVMAYVGADVTTAASPLSYIKAGDPPFLIFHGTADRLVSPSQTLVLHNALKAGGVHSTRYLLEGAGHGDLSFMGDFQSGLPWSSRQTMAIITDFLRQTLGSARP